MECLLKIVDMLYLTATVYLFNGNNHGFYFHNHRKLSF